ncbi:YwdI family protein [Metabacillus sp. Hm71]|uniref:YwdI family protein n=1 Tax=Metabacillus sp. Hm71 TaxID=3450743 RepID=UPI003F438CC5
MNIHVSKLLGKMEEELVKAKNSETDKELREKLVVIRSLCEIILEDDTSSSSLRIPSPKPNEINPAELQKMMGNYSTTANQQSGISSTRYKEEDANGDSLFDF